MCGISIYLCRFWVDLFGAPERKHLDGYVRGFRADAAITDAFDPHIVKLDENARCFERNLHPFPVVLNLCQTPESVRSGLNDEGRRGFLVPLVKTTDPSTRFNMRQLIAGVPCERNGFIHDNPANVEVNFAEIPILSHVFSRSLHHHR